MVVLIIFPENMMHNAPGQNFGALSSQTQCSRDISVPD